MRDQEISTLSIDKIVVSHGRDLDPDVVASIASSIELLGLQNPISVVEADDGVFRIISGRHRLAAVRSIGRDRIDVLIYRGLSDVEVRLAEIVENLHRAELTVIQRSEQIVEYAKLVNERQGEGVARVGQHLSNVKGASGRESGDSAAARDLGLTRQEIQRANKITNIEPAAKEAGLGDNQRAHLEVAGVPKEQQAIVVTELAEKKAKKVKAKDSGRRARMDVNDVLNAIITDFNHRELELIAEALYKALEESRVAEFDIHSLDLCLGQQN